MQNCQTLVCFPGSHVIDNYVYCFMPIPVAVRSQAWVCGRLLPRIRVRISPVAWIHVFCDCCVLSGRGLSDGLITHPEQSYRVWCVVCDNGGRKMRRDSLVCIATRYGLHGPGIESRWMRNIPRPFQTDSATHPFSCTLCRIKTHRLEKFLSANRKSRGVQLPS
jgi:hypothetical protein